MFPSQAPTPGSHVRVPCMPLQVCPSIRSSVVLWLLCLFWYCLCFLYFCNYIFFLSVWYLPKNHLQRCQSSTPHAHWMTTWVNTKLHPCTRISTHSALLHCDNTVWCRLQDTHSLFLQTMLVKQCATHVTKWWFISTTLTRSHSESDHDDTVWCKLHDFNHHPFEWRYIDLLCTHSQSQRDTQPQYTLIWQYCVMQASKVTLIIAHNNAFCSSCQTQFKSTIGYQESTRKHSMHPEYLVSHWHHCVISASSIMC